MGSVRYYILTNLALRFFTEKHPCFYGWGIREIPNNGSVLFGMFEGLNLELRVGGELKPVSHSCGGDSRANETIVFIRFVYCLLEGITYNKNIC
jgi:hypothetical protein